MESAAVDREMSAALGRDMTATDSAALGREMSEQESVAVGDREFSRTVAAVRKHMTETESAEVGRELTETGVLQREDGKFRRRAMQCWAKTKMKNATVGGWRIQPESNAVGR